MSAVSQITFVCADINLKEARQLTQYGFLLLHWMSYRPFFGGAELAEGRRALKAVFIAHSAAK